MIESDSMHSDSVDDDKNIPKSTDEYVGLEVAVCQDHGIHRSNKKLDNLVVVEMYSQNSCVSKSTEKCGEYIGLEAVDHICHDHHHDGSHGSLSNSDDEARVGSHDVEEYTSSGYVTSSDNSNNIKLVVAT